MLTIDPGVANELIRTGRAEAVALDPRKEVQTPAPPKKFKVKKIKK